MMNVGELFNQKHHFSDGLYAKEMHIPAGYVAGSHLHNYSHLSVLSKGSVSVTVEGVTTDYTAPACIEIKAGLQHLVLSKEDCVWFCIHATDETDADHIDEVLICRKD
jgi:quercetin dioxygenase-like cupin family protein